MSKLLRFFILGILISLYSLSVNAADTATASGKTPEYIPITKKPCYIGCGYQFQFCYYYNISNMNNAITVKEWNVEDGFITGKAAADINAKLLIKACYQLSLTAAYPVIDEDLNLEAEFEFKIKLSGDAKDQCIEYRKSSITYTAFELKGDVRTDPIPLMQGQLGQDMADIIQDSVSKAVFESLYENNRGKKFYCGENRDELYETDTICQCD